MQELKGSKAAATTLPIQSGRFTFGAQPLLVSRVPAFPLNEALRLQESSDLRGEVLSLFHNNSYFRCAIFISSQSLFEALSKETISESAILNAASYYIRMCSRPTPYGLFSSVGSVEVSDGATTLLQAPISDRRTETRMDHEAAADLLLNARSEVPLSDHSLVANDLIMRRGGRFHLSNPRTTRRIAVTSLSSLEEYTPISLAITPALEFILSTAERPILGGELIKEVCQAFSLEANRAKIFVERLIEVGLLFFSDHLSPLERDARAPVYCGAVSDSDFRLSLDAKKSALAEIDQIPLVEREHRDFEAAVASCFEALDNKNLIQVDMFHPSLGQLNSRVLNDVMTLAEVQMRFETANPLSNYLRAFSRRFEGDSRLVPLLELLDPGTGIGLHELATSAPQQLQSRRDQELIEIATSAALSGETVVSIDAGRLEALLPSPSQPNMPSSFEIGFQVVARTRAEIDSGQYKVLSTFGTDGIGKSLGRFANSIPRAKDLMRDLAAKATDKFDSVDAELAYLPSLVRHFNVMVRPRIHPYEIQVGFFEEAPGLQRISPHDLYVGIEEGVFFLWSSKLGRRVRINETHVFNSFSLAPSLPRFLACIAMQARRPTGTFDWGAASTLAFLPRLECERLILSQATWNLAKATLTAGLENGTFDALRSKWNLPDNVYLVKGDNRLLLNLASCAGLQLFRHQLQKHADVVRLCEVLPNASHLWLGDAEGKTYMAEFVATAIRTASPERPASRPQPSIAASAARCFPPGSSWSYFKIFCGLDEIDLLLRDSIAPMLNTLGTTIRKWFFVRYSDDGAHLRLRFLSKGRDKERVMKSVVECLDRFVRQRTIQKYSIDTYEREIERYGGLHAMTLIEEIFHLDSEVVLSALRVLPRDLDERMIMAAATFFGVFCEVLPEDRREPWLRARRLRMRTGKQDREWIQKAGEHIKDMHTDPRLHRAAAKLQDMAAAETLSVSLEEIADHLLHMHCNRFGLLTPAEQLLRFRLPQLFGTALRLARVPG